MQAKEPDRAGPDESRRSEADAESAADQGTAVRDDLSAALAAARQAQRIIAGRERQTDREARVAGDDVVRRREVEAMQEASARRGAVRQEPTPGRRLMSLDREEPELEAGQ